MTEHVTEMWQQIHDGLRGFIAKRVTEADEVDDILQEVFLRMHRKLDSLKDPDKVVSWIYQITRHAIIDHYRAPARTREVAIGLSGDLDSALPSLDFSELSRAALSTSHKDSGRLREELAGCLKPMIERLAREYREAVTLVELEGLTQNAAAKQLGLSLSGMKSRVQRGRKQLKRMLDDCCAIELDRRGGIVDYRARGSSCDPCNPPRT